MIATTLKPVKVVLDSDKELKKEEQVSYILKPLSAKKMFEYQAFISKGGETEQNPLENAGRLFEVALVGWENLKDSEGVLVPFPSAPSDALDILDVSTVTEIINKILELSTGFVAGKSEKN